MAKKTNEYFETFQIMGGFSHSAAKFLQNILENFDPTKIETSIKDLHAIEQKADVVKHEMMARLAAEFVAPIEREDIVLMVNELDNLTDAIEDVLMRIFMYNIRIIRPEALAMADVIVRICEALQVALVEFPNFRSISRPPQVPSLIVCTLTTSLTSHIFSVK